MTVRIAPLPGIRLQLLGHAVVTGPSGIDREAVLTRPKLLALLSYLAAAVPPGFHRRDTLLGMFWGEKNPARARGALRQSLYNLSNLLGSRILSSRGDEEVGLAFDILDCDAVSFEEALAHGADQEALDTYGGDLLEGFFISGAPTFERWLEQRRDDLRVQARDAAWRLAARAQATGQPIEAAHWARRARQLAPLDEERAARPRR
jgi:DNA-binding SARP family transcriptional activator